MKIGIIGAGKMATALAVAILEKGLIASSNFIASARSEESKRRFFSQFPSREIKWTSDNRLVVRESNFIILGLKPQTLLEIIEPLREESGGKVFLSLAAGVQLEKIEKVLDPTARLIRCMPNMPMLIGEGACAFALGKKTTEEDRILVEKLLNAGGLAVQVEENQMNAVNALSGSGPAYVFHFVKALIEGGVELGLSPSLAQTLALQTVLGAALMVKKTGMDPQVLADQIKSARGTTVAACEILSEKDWEGNLRQAMKAAFQRACELGGEIKER